MTIKLSTGLRNMLVYFSTRPGYVCLYRGGPPPKVDGPPRSILLFNPIPMIQGSANGGALTLTNSVSSAAIASGEIGWGRIIESFTDTAEGVAAAEAVADFTVGVFGSGADLVLHSVAVVTGDVLNLSLSIHYPML